MQKNEELTSLSTETSFDQSQMMDSSHEKILKTEIDFENKTKKINAKTPNQTRKNNIKTGSGAKKETRTTSTKTSNVLSKTPSTKSKKAIENNKTQTEKTKNNSSQNSETKKTNKISKETIDEKTIKSTKSETNVYSQKTRKTNSSSLTNSKKNNSTKSSKSNLKSSDSANSSTTNSEIDNFEISSKQSMKETKVSSPQKTQTKESTNTPKRKTSSSSSKTKSTKTDAKAKKTTNSSRSSKTTNSTSQTKRKKQPKETKTEILENEKNEVIVDDFKDSQNPVQNQELNSDDKTNEQNFTNEIVSEIGNDEEIQIDQTKIATIEKQEIPQNQIENDDKQNNSHRPHVIEIVTGSTIFKYFLSAMIIFGICFVTSLFTFNILLIPTEVQGYSMLPTINTSAIGENGDKHTDIVYVSKLKKIDHKDIVVIEAGKTTSGNRIIKRVIALPGDTITFKVTETKYEYFQNYFYVDIYLNGKKLEENYTKEKQTKIADSQESSSFYQFNNTLVSALDKDGEFSLTLNDDEYFVMGDNRNIYNLQGSENHGSVDSRMFGTVKKNEIIGTVSFIVEYGDNLFQAILKSLFSVRLQIL